MAQRRTQIWADRRLVLAVFVAAATVFVFFGVRLVGHAFRWSDAPHEAIAGWMTPRYVAHAWQVPPEVIADALGLERDGTGRRVSLEQLAAERGVSVGELAAAIEVAIAAQGREP